ncbi:MAG TPA: hypothetical protein VMS31_07720 [Pyrinomonadaceae bacterium]|nr:hypothetical protein [Pyrinomonadaceae bacterium]
MKNLKRPVVGAIAVLLICSLSLLVTAQEQATVLTGAELTRVIPPGFYFQGLSAPTQVRNSSAVRFGSSRYVLAGLVDTSGYAADVRAKYEGFLITDSAIAINGSALDTGAYGFGFSNDGKLNILDLAGHQIFSVATSRDATLRRPRPLVIIQSGGEVRLYSGKDYAVIVVK